MRVIERGAVSRFLRLSISRQRDGGRFPSGFTMFDNPERDGEERKGVYWPERFKVEKGGVMKRLVVAAAFAGAAALAPVANANLLLNGGFETSPCPGSLTFCAAIPGAPILSGWTVSAVPAGGSVEFVNDAYWDAAAGSWSLDLDGFSRGAIGQLFTTPASGATKFDLSFDLSGNPQGPPGLKLMQIDLLGATFVGGGTSRIVGYDVTGNSVTKMNWQTQFFSFVAALNAPVTLTFTSLSNLVSPGGFFYGPALDNVSVTQVPEPGTYALLLAGLGLMGFIARRRMRA